jgi:hypothetical protein
MCLHLVNFFVSFGLGAYKCTNAILAYYEIHGLHVGSSSPWRLGLGLLCHSHLPHKCVYTCIWWNWVTKEATQAP